MSFPGNKGKHMQGDIQRALRPLDRFTDNT